MAGKKTNWTLCALGIVACAAFLAPVTPSAGQNAVQQATPNQKGGGGKPARQAPAKQFAPKSGGTQHFNVNRSQPRVIVPHNQPKTFTRTQPANKNITIQRNKNITVQQKNITIQRNKNIHVQKNGVAPQHVRQFTPKGGKSKVVVTTKFRGVPVQGVHRTIIAGHNYSVWRGSRRFRYHNRWRTFVSLSLLGAIAIGAYEYYPYAYIDAPELYCDGLTEDGCQLVWQEVETIEGDIIPQCVAYCRWR
jgi:hypothetical protein